MAGLNTARRARVWAIAAGVITVATAVALGWFAFWVAELVQSAIDHPYGDSFGGLGTMVLTIMFGWTPILALGLYGAWSFRFRHEFGGVPLHAAAQRVGANVGRSWFVAHRVSAVLLFVAAFLCVWQGLAERSRLPGWPTFWVQCAILLVWVVVTIVILVRCQRAVDRNPGVDGDHRR